ncbi:2445_t:CDS:2, partial [Acaulospora colombiana]
MQQQRDFKLVTNLFSEGSDAPILCVCTSKVKKEDWQDHQIICPNRRLSCPAFVAFRSASVKFEQPYWKIFGDRYAEFSLSLVDSNCAPSLKEIAKIQVLKNLNSLKLKLKSSKLPSAIIHTLLWECPTFATKNELNKHMAGSCPYFKALDPISQRLPPKPIFFPYHCSACDQYLPSSDAHICIQQTPPDLPSPPPSSSEVDNNPIVIGMMPPMMHWNEDAGMCK